VGIAKEAILLLKSGFVGVAELVDALGLGPSGLCP